MRVKISLILDEGDTHPASLSLAGTANIVLDSENCGHVEVPADQVTVNTVAYEPDEPEEQYEPQDY